MRLIYLWFTFYFLSSTSLKAQLLEYQKVIEAPGVRPSIIIERANKWAATSFTSYQSIFQFKDSTTLSLIPALTTIYTGGKGMTFHSDRHQYNFNLVVESKQGRFRVTIDNFRLVGGVDKSPVLVREVILKSVADSKLNTKWKRMQTDSWNREYDQIEREVNRILLQLEAAVKVVGKNEDW